MSAGEVTAMGGGGVGNKAAKNGLQVGKDVTSVSYVSSSPIKCD